MEKYMVTGMSCAACQSRVEKAVSNIDGVTSCSVSLLTNSMSVEGDVPPAQVIEAVEQAGYGASVKGEAKANTDYLKEEAEALEDHETPILKRRLCWSLGFLVVLMYVSMGHNMLNWPIPSFLVHNHTGLALTQCLLSFLVLIINQKFFTSGFRNLFAGSPNMDTLVALGSSVSFGWSIVVFYKLTILVTQGVDPMQVMMVYHNELYFESAAMIPTLITFGKMLEARSKGKTTSALRGLMNLAPKTATVLKGTTEEVVPVSEVAIGDIFVVRPGESIPVDGVILEGSAAINASALTGESIPQDCTVGDTISAATLNETGYLKAKATAIGEDTSLAKIITMVSDASASKAPIARIADQVSGVFVPIVIALAIVTTIGWLIAGVSFAVALERGISVLVISCPCALGLATPVAIMVGNGKAAENGVLFKTSEALEETGKTQIVALDKTGTITTGIPVVTDLLPSGISEDQLLQLAGSLEFKSEHPLAKAVVNYMQEKGLTTLESEDFQNAVGHGLTATIQSKSMHGGNQAYIETFTTLSAEIKQQAFSLAKVGKTPLYFEQNGTFLGMIAVADAIKPDSKLAIQQLHALGIETVMLTGDNEDTAKAIAKDAGVDRVIAGVLPDGKAAEIARLKQRGKTVMVGDGINDAPALTSADIGIAIGAGTDIALDAADVVLMKSSLLDVPSAIRMSRKTLKNIHENLFWAFFYNVVCIPLAMGLYPMKLNPMVGALAMSLSSVTVVTNALRLNLFHMEDSSRDRPQKTKRLKQTPTTETTTVAVEGMMCGHCEATVVKAIEAIPGVEQAVANYQTGIVTIQRNPTVTDQAIQTAIKDAGYQIAKKSEEGEMKMKKIMKVEGMMCGHCEANVKAALEAVDGITCATADHNTGTVTVECDHEVSNDVLKTTVEAKDYHVTDIQ